MFLNTHDLKTLYKADGKPFEAKINYVRAFCRPNGYDEFSLRFLETKHVLIISHFEGSSSTMIWSDMGE